MGYDPAKDKVIFGEKMNNSRGEELSAYVHQYNGGQKKLALVRKFPDESGFMRFGKLERLTEDEVRWLANILPEIVEEYF